jgi:hypothetical protein
MEASTTLPFSSCSVCGSMMPLAPCSTAYAYAAAASGTSMDRSMTPSPWAATCSVRKRPQPVEGLMTEVKTKRAAPDSRT